MSPGVSREVGALQHQAKILDVAVQVAANQHFAGVVDIDDASCASGCILPMPGGLAKRCQQSGGVGHESSQESVRMAAARSWAWEFGWFLGGFFRSCRFHRL